MEKAISTRERVLTEVVKEHRPRLLSVIRKRIRDGVEAEDILQDVLAEFLIAYDLGQAIETLSAWLVRVAQNKIIDRFRRRKSQERLKEGVSQENDPAAVTQPDEEWTRGFLRREIAAALELLPPEQREVFVKHELEGKSFEKIAAETGVGLSTLLSRKRYAVIFLRDHLKEVYDELE